MNYRSLKSYLLFSSLVFMNILGLLLLSCEDQLPELEYVKFSGVILDALTSEPIQGASLILVENDSITRKSSVDGTFQFVNLKIDDGTYSIVGVKEDYANAEGVFTITEGKLADSVTLSMTAKEALEFGSNILDFGASLDSVVLKITNVSTAAQTISIASADPWISAKTTSLSISAGSNSNLTFKISRESLAVGQHQSSIIFQIEGKPSQSLSAKCQKLDPTSAILKLNETSLDFGKATNAQSVIISNEGQGILEWTAETEDSWISFDPSSGSVEPNGQKFINITVKRDLIESEGSYNGEVSFESNGGTGTLSVTAQVDGSVGILGIDPVSLDFGPTDSRKSIRISNTGESEITWTATPDESWLSIDLTGVSNTLSANTFRNLDVSVDRGELSRGTYTGTIVFSANGEESSLNVSMEVAVGELVLNTDSIGFGLDQTSFALELKNQGNASISWTASDTENWISRDKSNGMLNPDATTSINVSVNRVGLEQGDYVGTVSIEVNGETINIPVTMKSPGGVLSLSLENIDFGLDKNSQSVVLSNTGTVALDYTVSSEDDWLSFSRVSGSISRGGSFTLSVTVNRNGFEKGTYEGLVIFSANERTINLPVSMEAPGGVLSLDPEDLLFSYDKSNLPIKLTNTGTSTLSWEAEAGSSWLTLDTDKGNLAESANITIQAAVNREGLPQGDYSSTITFINGEQSVTVPVELIVEGGVLTYTPSNLNFGAVETNLFVTISNTGLGALNWQVSESESWLTMNSSGGTIQASQQVSLSVSVNRSGLDLGTYSGIISLTGDGGDGSITVQMSVEQDTDNDGIPNNIDADNDNDGLIDIYTINDLYDIRYDLTASGSNLQGGPSSGFIGYELMNDLNFSSDADYDDLSLKAEVTTGSGWLPIGTGSGRFAAVFEGNGFKILDLLIDNTGDYVGLFSDINNIAEIRNLSLEIKFFSARDYVGGLVGYIDGGTVKNCDVKGVITADDYVGLLVGSLDNSGIVSQSFAEGTINADWYVGGLIGYVGKRYSESNVDHSWANCIINATARLGGLVGESQYGNFNSCYSKGVITASDQYSGGLVGYSNAADISSCYSKASINSSSSFVGGLIGAYGSMTTCYALGSVNGTSYVGGIVGRYGNGTSSNYWDINTTGTTNSSIGTGLTTQELQSPTSNVGIYATWSSDDWDFGTSTQYPALKNMPGGIENQR